MQQAARPRYYRPDIDGLRAVAVLLVIAFHLDLSLPRNFGTWLGKLLHRPAGFVSLFPRGGFIGVDVFFVISGFLIGGILLREQASGTLSLARFYERRIRRIAPALVAVLLLTFAVAWLSFLPSEMAQFAHSQLAAAFSWSNLFFWRTSGYFDVPALAQPLLHTWSLSVEEQFYLVFPLALVLFKRFAPNQLKAVLIATTLLSFVTSVFLVFNYPIAAFYLAPSRAWELLAGAMIPLGLVPCPRSSTARNLASCCGLAMVLYAGFRYTIHTPFPGVAALLPCLGALLILAASVHGTSVVGNLLSTRPMVFVGLISYSLYLWHWPLLLASRFEYLPHVRFSTGQLLALLLLTSVASWSLIEQPFRKTQVSRRSVFAAAALAAILLAGINGWAIQSQGFRWRFSPQLLQLDRYREQVRMEPKWGNGCFLSAATSTLAKSCLTVSSTQPNFLLFGSSYAAHLWYGLSIVYPEFHIVQATASQCNPLLASYLSSQPFCREMVKTVFGQFLPNHKINGVILASVWFEDDLPSLAQTVSHLHQQHIRVYVIGPVPGYDEPLPKLLFRSIRLNDPSFPTRHRAQTDAEYRLWDEHVAAVASSSGADGYISLRNLLCSGGECAKYAAPGIPLQSDEAHLTNEGSLLVARRFREHHCFLERLQIP